MSRIVRVPYQPGDLADASRLNADFSAFAQTGAVDGSNLRDAALDLPQFANNIIILNAAQVEVGTGAAGWQHNAPRTAPSSVAAPATKTPLVNGAGNPTPLGPFAWTLNAGDVLRVYWDLSVRPRYTGTPWTSGDGEIQIEKSGGGNHTINMGAHCWLVSLQWDVTSGSLTNFVEVSGQTSYTSAVGGRTGGKLSDSPASVPVPAWKLSTTNIDNGAWGGSSTEIDEGPGWTSACGAWYYLPPAPITVYGIRLVIHGIYHPAQTATENYLVVDTAVGGANQYLEYDGGELVAIHQRTGA
jgi:hypothetical protein